MKLTMRMLLSGEVRRHTLISVGQRGRGRRLLSEGLSRKVGRIAGGTLHPAGEILLLAFLLLVAASSGKTSLGADLIHFDHDLNTFRPFTQISVFQKFFSSHSLDLKDHFCGLL